MKKLLILVLTLFCACSVVACTDDTPTGGSSSTPTVEESREETYVVSFVQEGQEVIKKYVKEGETLTDIPTPVAVEGYDVVWESASFENIFANMTIKAVATPKSYQITYDAGEGTVSSTTQTVVYDKKYALLTPTREGFNFVCWNYGENAFASEGTWKTASEITLTAVWQKIEVYTFSVIFVQEGQPIVEKKVNVGEKLSATDIPEVKQTAVGYDIVWNKSVEEIAALTDNTVVEAVKIGKFYTVSLTLGEGESAGAEIAATTAQVQMGEVPALPTPTCTGLTFLGWKTTDGTFLGINDVWEIPEDTTLVATWKNGDYTDNY